MLYLEQSGVGVTVGVEVMVGVAVGVNVGKFAVIPTWQTLSNTRSTEVSPTSGAATGWKTAA